MEATTREPSFAGFDPLGAAAYSLGLAAYYVRMPRATLKTWVLGRSYKTHDGEEWSPPVIDIADREKEQLSFWNLVEAWVLRAMRVKHDVPLQRVRKALENVAAQFQIERPLAHASWRAGGAKLFLEDKGLFWDPSTRARQSIMEHVAVHLDRVRWNEEGMAEWLFPFTRDLVLEDAGAAPKIVALTPRIAFGAPIISRTGVPTSAIVDRFRGGDSPEHLSEEYGITRDEVDEAIRWELYLAQKQAA